MTFNSTSSEKNKTKHSDEAQYNSSTSKDLQEPHTPTQRQTKEHGGQWQQHQAQCGITELQWPGGGGRWGGGWVRQGELQRWWISFIKVFVSEVKGLIQDSLWSTGEASRTPQNQRELTWAEICGSLRTGLHCPRVRFSASLHNN